MDIASLLNQTEFKYHPHFEANRMKRRFLSKTLPFRMRGKVSLKDAVWNLLPGKLHTEALTNTISTFAENELRRSFDRWRSGDDLKLFGHVVRTINTSYAEWLDLLLLAQQIVVRDQYFVRKFLRPDATVIDAGANLGIFSIFAAQLAPKGTVFAFEPAPPTYERLRGNVGPYAAVQPINAALGDSEQLSEILIYDHSCGGNALVDSEVVSKVGVENFHGRHEVEVKTLDRFVEESNVGRVDYIKIDTEGYEKQILRGAEQTIRRWAPVIGVSAYHLEEDKEEMPRIVRSINPGYQFELVQEWEEVFILCVP